MDRGPWTVNRELASVDRDLVGPRSTLHAPRLFCFWILAAGIWASSAAGADDALDDFNRRVGPLLAGHCLVCHGSEQKGGLDLRTRETALAGGDSGIVLVPGNAAESLLYQHVASAHMPPEKALSSDEVAIVEQWIEDGAFFPPQPIDPYAYSTARRAGYDWWSLKPVRKVHAPLPERSVDQDLPPGWSAIDAFIVAQLGRNGLSLSEPADRAAWLRRVTCDLHGLPPTYEDVREFIDDKRPDAFERVVDRLLASPRYGERWGRHWLDVVRFAESNGFERDRIRENFWPYRDWVISALNQDMPYDEFVREQLAADALHPNDPPANVPTGFLVAGPKNDVETISELEKLTTRQDELDEFVVATCNSFLGLTVGCARCHDHKFDPIPSLDYYRLTAVFSGLDRGDNVIALPIDQQAHAAAVAAGAQRAGEIRGRLEQLLGPPRARLLAERDGTQPDAVPATELPMVNAVLNEDTFASTPARFVRFVIARTSDGSEPCLDELEVYGEDPGRNLARGLESHGAGANASASSLLPGFAIHQVEHLNDGRYGNSWSWISNERGQGWVEIDLAESVPIERVVWGRDRDGIYKDRLPVNYRIEVSADQQTWSIVSSSQRRAPPRTDGAAAEQIPLDDVLASLDDVERGTYQALAQELKEAEAALAQIAPLPVSYSARENPPREAHVLRRGNVRDRQEPVRPGALGAVKTLDAEFKFDGTDSGPLRRLRLAEWIIDPRNPLTARVLVNRVWHYHFGQGIVGTPSDLGFNGESPSHPELLDWLASDLVGDGWQLKHLHRRIVLSATYRQSSGIVARAAEIDGTNRLYWRMNPRRLEAEALRDAVLVASGALDHRMGGPGFRLFEYRDGNVPDYVLAQDVGRDTWRRAVYMFNIRTFREPLMTVFDCPDPSVATPRRDNSTTALQALSLLNNSFIFEQSRLLAERAERLTGPEAPSASQITQVWRLALARDPTAGELTQAAEFAQAHGLASLCRVLFNTNEFLYVR